MSLFCNLLGHTWVPETSGANPRWNTTKDQVVLEATELDEGVRYYDVCRRCGTRREATVRGAYDQRAAN